MVTAFWKDIDIDNIKGILWDMDNTLYLYEPVHKIAYEACMKAASERYGIDEESFGKQWKAARNKVHHDLHGQGASHSRLLYVQKVFEYQFGYTNPSFALEMEQVYWTEFLDRMIWREGALELMENAKSKGIQMAIVTDLTAAIQLRKFIRLELGRYVRFLVSSEEAGVEKPGAGIFQLALDKLDLKAEDVIMIGDSFEKDFQGAQALGIQAYLIDDSTR